MPNPLTQIAIDFRPATPTVSPNSGSATKGATITLVVIVPRLAAVPQVGPTFSSALALGATWTTSDSPDKTTHQGTLQVSSTANAGPHGYSLKLTGVSVGQKTATGSIDVSN
jgi:hypothetical protein